MQSSCLMSVPSQGFPPKLGLGLVQLRRNILVPEPHVTEQPRSCSHSVHAPSTLKYRAHNQNYILWPFQTLSKLHFTAGPCPLLNPGRIVGPDMISDEEKTTVKPCAINADGK